jgi:hypothetical protein
MAGTSPAMTRFSGSSNTVMRGLDPRISGRLSPHPELVDGEGDNRILRQAQHEVITGSTNTVMPALVAAMTDEEWVAVP